MNLKSYLALIKEQRELESDQDVNEFLNDDRMLDLASLMDDNLREQLHSEMCPCTSLMCPCTNLEFLNAYAKLHLKTFKEEWEIF